MGRQARCVVLFFSAMSLGYFLPAIVCAFLRVKMGTNRAQHGH